MFARVWRFTPRPDRLDEFTRVYGPDGPWATLFRRAADFVDTALVFTGDGRRFLTVDVWREAAAWEAFRNSQAAACEARDRETAALVAGEEDLGCLRRARPNDAEVLASLSGDLGYPTTGAALGARLAIVSARSDEIVLVAEEPSRGVAGWVHVFGAVRLESEPYAEIGGLIVDAGARGGGLGAALLAAAEVWARDRGDHDMRVRSNVLRERAHRFYARSGYVLTKSQRVFVKVLGR